MYRRRLHVGCIAGPYVARARFQTFVGKSCPRERREWWWARVQAGGGLGARWGDVRATITAMRIRLPTGLEEQRERGPDWGRWLDRLPHLFVGMLDEWALTRDGEDLWHGFCSLVAPVISADGTRAVLKLTFDGDSESLKEGLVLQRWHGEGAVRFRCYPLVVAAVIGEGREPRSRLADLLIVASGHANNVDLCTRNGEGFVCMEELVLVVAI